MSSQDSFSVAGSSPTKKKWDFRVEHHGSICLEAAREQVFAFQFVDGGAESRVFGLTNH
jgi:hypothetical protein